MKEIKIILLFSQTTLLESNRVCPLKKKKGGRERIKKMRFSFHCVIIFFSFNRHTLVIISESGCLRRHVLISSGGESL